MELYAAPYTVCRFHPRIFQKLLEKNKFVKFPYFSFRTFYKLTYLEIVWNMKSCPVADVMDRMMQWKKKSSYLNMKAKLAVKSPWEIRDQIVKRHEKRFTPNIIWIDVILYVLNSSPCQLEVKLSNVM